MAASAQSLQRGSAGFFLRLWRSSLGKKYVVAITGLGLFLFVVVHMLGNLQIFFGPENLNAYGKALKSTPALLWGARIGLLLITVLHITATVQLAIANRRARPVGYAVGKPVASNFASRTMIISGLILLAFIVFHLAHFTIGLVDPTYLDLQDPLDLSRHDIYQMIINGFSNPLVAIFYIVSMGLLLLHLSHGVVSMFQSIGLRSKKILWILDKSAKGIALILFLGNASIPVAVLAGFLK
jgi:succinate dehydrogenase / fumarate reductase, cytochrome b subunit